MSDRQELVLLLREVMRWEKRMLRATQYDPEGWNDLHDILNRAHVATSTDSRARPRQRPQKPVLTPR